jgi:hypothetical protein
MNQVLSKIYYNASHPAGFAGARAVLKYTKGKYSANKVKEWLQSQDTYTLHKPVKIKFKRNKYITNNIDQLWEADLNDMRGLSQYNDGVKYLLSVIDVFSKYGFLVPLKNKTNTCVQEAFENIFKHSGRKPEHLRTDKGTEFNGKNILDFFKKNGINYYTTKNPDVKAAVVERWNRTIKTRMWRYLTHNNTYRYIDVLDDIVNAYNNSVHTTIRMAPAEVNETNVLQVWKNLFSKQTNYTKPRFKVGDTVRIVKERKHFEKGYETKWSEEIFTVHRIIKHPRPAYELQDLNYETIDGYFYEDEIQKVTVPKTKTFKIDKILDTKGKGSSKKYLVKWKGYSSAFNSWIPASQLVTLK